MAEKKNIVPPQTIEEALAQIKDLEAKNESLKTLLSEQNEHISKLEAKLAKGGKTIPTIKVGKREFEVVAAYRGKGGKIYKAEQIAEDVELATSILKIEGQNILVELEPEKGGTK